MMISLFLLTMTLLFSKVTIHLLSHNCPIEMRLAWRLGNISACFSWFDNFSAESGLGVWILLWISWRVSYLLGFLMAPLCGILLLGHIGSFLCILSRLLGHLCVVVV